MIRQQPAGTVDGARYSRRHGLVDGDRARTAAVSGRRLRVSVTRWLLLLLSHRGRLTIAVEVLLAFSILLPAGHVFLHSTEARLFAVPLLFDLAVSLVWRGSATTVGVLAVHAHLRGRAWFVNIGRQMEQNQ